jgi:hypothetical protein
MYLVYMIINISKSSLLIASITLHLMMLVAVYYGAYTTRQELKSYVFNLEPIRLNIPTKKEIFTKVFNNKPTTANIKYNSFLNNSIN